MKTVTVTWEARFHEEVEVPDDWTYDGSLTSALKLTDMPFHAGELTDWDVKE